MLIWIEGSWKLGLRNGLRTSGNKENATKSCKAIFERGSGVMESTRTVGTIKR